MTTPVNVNPQLEKNIKSMTAGAQVAIVLCADAFRFGGNWGFIRSDKPDFRDQLETLKTERPNVKALPVSNGALILVNEDFLAYNVNIAVPNAIDAPFVDMANKRRNEERQRFQKFIENVAKGKVSAVKKKGNFYELTLGVFCVNDTNAIRVGGIEYPAYKLSLVEAVTYTDHLTALGRTVKVRAVNKDGREVFEDIKGLMNSNGLAAMYKGLEIADSGTGLFLTIHIY